MSAAEESHLDWAGLGEEIRRSRVAAGMSQQQLADQAALDRKTIGNYEKGRVPGPGRVPDGYFAVARVLAWPAGHVELVLGAPSPPRAPLPAAQQPAALFRGDPSPVELYPNVIAFARACVKAGADPALRDALEEAAERLLHSASGTRGQQSSYGLVAYRPHGWAEGDPGVPADDAARIEQALREHREGRK